MKALARIALLASPFAVVGARRLVPDFELLAGQAPDPLAAALAFAALRGEPVRACLFASACGFLVDVPAGTTFGLGGARCAFVAAVLVSFARHLEARDSGIAALATLLAGLLERGLALLALEPNAPAALMKRVVVGAFASALLGPLVFALGAALLDEARRRRSGPSVGLRPRGSF